MKNKVTIIVIGIIAALLSIVAAISTNIYDYCKNEINYVIEFTEETKIKDIEINDNKYNFWMFVNDKIQAKDDEYLYSVNSGEKIEIKASIIDKFCITFVESDSPNNNNDMIVYRGEELQNVDGNKYLYDIDKFTIIKESVNSYAIIWFILFLFVFFALILYLYIYYMKIKDGSIKLYNIILAIIDMFIIFLFTYYLLFLVLESFIIIPIICVIIYNLYILITMPNKEMHHIYAMFIVIVSIAMLFMMPPFNVPDEASHFFRAYKDSLFIKDVDDGGQMNFPICVRDLTDRFARNLHSDDNKLYPQNYISEVFKKSDYSILTPGTINYGNVKNLSFLPYLPSAVVIFIGRLFNMPVLVLFLLCRLANIIIVSCVCYIAIKLVPKFKKAVLLVSMFPMFIQQAAAINMDYMNNATIIMLISYTIFLIYKVEKINIKHLGVMALLCSVLTLGKFGYFPILALMFLIPNNKFKNIKIAMTSKILFITIAFVISFALNMSVATNENIDVPQIDNVYGFKYVFKNPLRMIKIIISTMINRLDLDSFRGFIDGFGYSTVWNRGVFALLQIIMFFLYIMIKDDDDDTLNLNSRAVYLLIYFSIIGIIYVIAFLLFTKSGEKNIFGIQARYFIAPSLLLYIGVSNNKLLLKISNKKNFYSIITAISYVTAFISISFFYI